MAFYNSSIIIDGEIKGSLSLDSTLFEDAWISSYDNAWPCIDYLSFEHVHKWFLKFKIVVRQTANCNIERTLFSLLHVVKIDGYEFSSLVWLALALESLFDTPSTMISKLLKDRIFILLDTPIENRKSISKKLNDFYNLRSRFVHGDINIDNSINNDILDENAYSYLNEIKLYINLKRGYT